MRPHAPPAARANPKGVMEPMTLELLADFAPIWVPILALVIYTYFTWQLLWLRLDVGRGSDAFAAETFLKLLGDARDEMLACDDGRAAAGSLCEDPEVIRAVREKLERNARFEMRCIFSSDDSTAFRRAFEGYDRVRIKTGVARRDIHYQIIDRGWKGYVSRHRSGEAGQSYKLYERAIGWVRREALGRHLADIDRELPQAA